MSDPAKSPKEIEDVLSSIRRLVAEHQPTPSASPEAGAEGEGADGRLMLTPAFRITDPDDPWAPVPRRPLPVKDVLPELDADDTPEDDAPEPEDTPATADEPPAPAMAEDLEPETDDGDEPVEAWALEDRMSDWDEVEDSAAEAVADVLADAQARTPEAWSHLSSTVEDRDDDRPAEPVNEPTDETEAAEFADPDIEPTGSGVDGFDPDEIATADELAELALIDGTVADPTAEFEPEVGHSNWPDAVAEAALRDMAQARAGASSRLSGTRPEGPAQDANADGEAEGAALHEAAAMEERTEAPDPVAPEPVDQDNDLPAPETEGHPEDEPTLRADPVNDDWGGDMPDRDPPFEDGAAGAEGAPPDPHSHTPREADRYAEATPEPEHAAEPVVEEPIQEGVREILETVEDLGDEASPFSFPDADSDILDEDTLREIIVDVVREELQGALGQRITRNVRKMVRREIRIALAAEDLE